MTVNLQMAACVMEQPSNHPYDVQPIAMMVLGNQPDPMFGSMFVDELAPAKSVMMSKAIGMVCCQSQIGIDEGFKAIPLE